MYAILAMEVAGVMAESHLNYYAGFADLQLGCTKKIYIYFFFFTFIL